MDFILSCARNPHTIGYREEKAFFLLMYARGREQTMEAHFLKLNVGPFKFVGFFCLVGFGFVRWWCCFVCF